MKKTMENLVKEQVKDYLTIMGWFHFPIAQNVCSFKGICDRIAIKKGKVLFIECKSPKGQLNPDQKKFKQSIEASGGIYIVARGYEDIEELIK